MAADPPGSDRAVVVAPDRTPAPLANLALRTLAALKADETAIAQPRQLIVSADGSAMFTTIAAALAVAIDGDEILVRPGEYRESVVIDKSVRILGGGPGAAIVVRPPAADEPCFRIVGGEAHVAGLSIDGTEFDDYDNFDSVLVEVVGGSPTLDELDIRGGGGVVFSRAGTRGAVTRCAIHDGQVIGIEVRDGASPRIEDNEIWGTGELYIFGAGSDPLVRANRIHDGQSYGIWVSHGASPRIEDNEVWGNAGDGLHIAYSDPLVRANRIHDGQSTGIWVRHGASPRIEDNEIWGNARAGLGITGAGSDPLVRANRIHDGQATGILVHGGASPRIEDNEIWGNALLPIHVENASPNIGSNVTDD